MTVDGTNFNPAAGATTVKLNQSSATASSVTTTQLAFAVPAATGSGRIRVTTGAGTAVSASDFIVPPGGVAAADILATTRLAADGPAQSIGLFATGKYGLVLFDGAAGAWMSLHVGNFTVNPAGATIAYTIYKPDNTQLASGTLSGTNLSIHLPALPTAGTYSLLLRTGIAQVSLDAKLETNALRSRGRNDARRRAKRGAVHAGADRGRGRRAEGLDGVGTRHDARRQHVSISRLRCRADRRSAEPTPRVSARRRRCRRSPSTGTHAVVLVPSAGTTQSAFKVGLLGGVAIPVDGAAADVAIANPGEGARLTFAGVAGENLGLGVSGVALSPASVTTTNVSVYKPDASLLASVSCGTDGTQCATNLENLPVTGTYTIIVQPASGATGTQRLWLSHDVAGHARQRHSARASRSRVPARTRASPSRVRRERCSRCRCAPWRPIRRVRVLLVLVSQPDKSLLVYTHLTGAGQTLVTPPLPVTGTYTVFIEPESAAQGAATATMEVLLDPGQALAIDGPTLTPPSASRAERRAFCSRERRARTSGLASATSR